MSDVIKLRQLSLKELLVLCSSVIILPLVAWLLKIRGFRHTERMLAKFSRSITVTERDDERVAWVARMVSVAAERGPFDAQCLEKAITLWWMLGLMGIGSTVRLGIYKLGEKVEAHAWVIHNDNVVIGQVQGLDDFTPLLDVNISRN